MAYRSPAGCTCAEACIWLPAGTVPFRSGERISFTFLVSQKYTNDTVRRPEHDCPQPVQLCSQDVLPGMPNDMHARASAAARDTATA